MTFIMEAQKAFTAEAGGDVSTEARCFIALKMEGICIKGGRKQSL